MSNLQNYTEMIDAYLTGQLNQEDSARLMERLEQDPALKEEFLLQQDLVHSLQEHRRNELKARLNKIEVGTGTSFPGAGALKMVAATALVALVGTGIYFAFDKGSDQPQEAIHQVEISAAEGRNTLSIAELPEKPEVKKSTELIVIEKDKAAEESSISKSEKAPTAPQESKENLVKKSSKLNEISKPDAVASAKEKSSEETTAVVKPEVISFFEEQDPSANTPEADTPEEKLNNARSFITQNIEVTTVSDRRYTFHYMFFENQLHMYGEFNKVPYEVLEVNTGTQTKYFLYHDGLYYELNPDQRTITRLRELKNENMIKELEITRNEKLKR